ncbi:MAG: hypothetical protein CMJ58_04280 [Planctomycetaceae bacterium]|nr:hypothetical protein [Planctomycetaceae bacterium]
MTRTFTRFALHGLCSAAALVAFGAANASAQLTIYDAGGFEAARGFSATFSPGVGYTGQLEGQAVGDVDLWSTPIGGTGTSTATVVTGVNSPLGAAGSQAVEVYKGDTDARWGVRTGIYPSQGEDFICIEWDMMIPSPGSGGTPGTDFGPFMGIETYYDQNLTVHSSFGVDATSGTVLVGEAGTGNLVLTDTAKDVAFDAWNSFRIELDFTAKTSTAFLNGELINVESFVDAGALFFTDADITAVSEGPAFDGLTATAYFDNYTVHEGACIPEPATLALAAMSLIGLAWRRRLA